MKIQLYCIDCLKELLSQKDCKNSESDPIFAIVNELSDNGLYFYTCPKGHASKAILSNLKFELLFDLGLHAINDGYYREAVSSFTSSLERFYEFYIKVSWHSHGSSFDQIEQTWKQIANQSERQLGAFISCFINDNIAQPQLMNSNKEIPFRNNVIHKGYIPKREEAIDYSKLILELIEKPLLKQKKKLSRAVNAVYHYYSPKNQISVSEDDDIFITNQLTIIDVLNGREERRDDFRNGSIEQILTVLKDNDEKTKIRLRLSFKKKK